MAEFNLPFGVRIANSDPIDKDRYIAADITARDAIVSAGRAYEGLQIYVEADQTLYILTDEVTPAWDIVGSDSSALTDLKNYVDGSLGERDTSININTKAIVILDSSIQRIDTELNQVDASLQLINNEIAQLDASIVTLDSSVVWLFANQYDASGSYLPLTGGSLSGDLAVGGDLVVDGSVYVVGTETIDVSAAYIHLNTGLTIAPPDYMQSGIVVERGTEDPYAFVYDESLEQFRIGIAPFDGSQYNDASTQAVATREDAPVDDGIAFWNNDENRFDTSTGFTLDILTGSTGYIPTYGSPLSQSTLSFISGTLKNNANEDFIIETVPNLLSGNNNLILKTPDASLNAGDVILKAGNVTSGTSRGNIALVPGDQPGIGIIELSDNTSQNTSMYLTAKGANANVGISINPKGVGNLHLGGRTLIGTGNEFDFNYTSTYHQMVIDPDKPALITLGSSGSGTTPNEFIIRGGQGVDASFGGDLVLEAGNAGNTGIGGSLTLSAGAGAGGDADGSIYMLNIAEASTSKILFYNTADGAVAYGDAPDTGVVPTDNILEWDSGSSYYRPYSAFSSEHFYDGTTDPTGTTRLNLDRRLYLPALNVKNSAPSGNGLTVYTTGGAALSGHQSETLTTNSTQPLIYLTRQPGGDASIIGDIIKIVDNPTVTGTVAGAILYAQVDNTRMIDLNPRVVDSSSAIAYYLNTVDTLSDSSAKLLSIANNNTEKFFVNKDGSVWSNGIWLGGSVSLTNLTDISIGGTIPDGSALIYNSAGSYWTYGTAGSSSPDYWTLDGSTLIPSDESVDVKLGRIGIGADAGAITLVDMDVSSATAGTEESYSLDLAGNKVAQVWGLSDGAGDASVTGFVVEADAQYMGNPETDGSWRFYIGADSSLVFERRISGIWTYKGSFAG